MPKTIRVVVFCHPPRWEWGVKRFLRILEEHPEIEVAGVFCQARDGSIRERVRRIRKYRGWLFLPIVVVEGVKALRRLLAQPLEVMRIEKRIAGLAGRIRYVPDIHAAAVLAEVRALAPDLGLIYGAPLLKPQLFNIPLRGTLGIHHGRLPDYRGVKTAFWAMFRGEETAGVTIQRVNAGLDTGDIVKVGGVPVAGKSLGRVCREVEDLGLDLYVQAVLEVKERKARFVRLPKKGKVYRQPGPGILLQFHWRQMKKRLGLA